MFDPSRYLRWRKACWTNQPSASFSQNQFQEREDPNHFMRTVLKKHRKNQNLWYSQGLTHHAFLVQKSDRSRLGSVLEASSMRQLH